MKYIFLLNSFSLKNKTNEVYKKLSIVADELKLDYIIEINSDKKSTEDILYKYRDTKNIIMCLGGDGTINRTLNSIVGTDNILGYIPYGTGNDFYHSTRDLLNEGINNIDLVRINDKYFINVACFGIDADIANTDELVHSKIIPKSQRYNIAIINHFLKYKARHLKVIFGNKEYAADYTTIAVCNARYYGGGYKIGPNASLKDGQVDVYLADKLSKLNMAKLILSMKNGNHEKSQHIKVIKTDNLKIISPIEITCNIDGDKLTSKVFDIEVIPKGIEVYYNQELINKLVKTRKK